MSLAELSIKRPTFITCLITIMIAMGIFSMQRLGVDLFPNITFPIVTVSTAYPGAGPAEIETLVSKPLEEEISTLGGIKRVTSVNQEGLSRVVAEFTLETDIKNAEQQIRDRLGAAKRKMPTDIKEPVVRRIDPADQPILMLSITADLSETELFDLADDKLRPKFEQIAQVGLVEVIGGRKREIQVQLDRSRLKSREISVSQVANRLQASGENIPAGKITTGAKDTVFRTLGEFNAIRDIESSLVNFWGDEKPTTVKDLGRVVDTQVDETARTFVNGKKSLFIQVFRQSGANTIAVADSVRARLEKLNLEMKNAPGKPVITVVRDGSWWIRANVTDVKESIFLGIFLAVAVVFLFLANGRSTIITGLALPNSLIGAFILMAWAGFSINIMTLLALSLSVGLLIDDAIVVRENIFRHIEMGKKSITAALVGTAEVRLAVIATTLVVIAVFGPVAFLKGVVGQFFREFGLTICFAMLISLFDALTIAPMLSAYLAGISHKDKKPGLWDRTLGRPLIWFSRFQDSLERAYGKLLAFTLHRPKLVLSVSFAIFLASCSVVRYVPKTFLPPPDSGEFQVGLDLPPGTSLDSMNKVSAQVDEIIRANREVEVSALTVGGRDGESNVADIYVHLVPLKQRGVTTTQVKERIREQLKPVAFANPTVKDYDAVGGGQRQFQLLIVGFDQKELERVASETFEKFKTHKGLLDIETTYRPGKPEMQIIPDKIRMQQLGISTAVLGQELRSQVEGIVPAKFREKGIEYDVRVRLQNDQRNIKTEFPKIFVPNINNNLIRLSDVAKPLETEGPAKITRQDRGRYIGIYADVAPDPGMNAVITDINKWFTTEKPLPPGMKYMFIGQAENFQELQQSMGVALGFGVLFIFLVLASLYESFVTPFTIMLALPLAVCGSLVALFVTQQSLNIFSMIGIIMLLGVASKNSILLVDLANQLIAEGLSRRDAVIKAGTTRLRPILMTTMALIAGTTPIALGLNEASRQRTSMGVAIIGGLISSTLLTLVVVPAAFSFIDRFRLWSKKWIQKGFSVNPTEPLLAGGGSDPLPAQKSGLD